MDSKAFFEILVRENSEMLELFLRSLVRDEASVDDLFQETMLVAWRRLEDFDRTRRFGPWLRGIAAKLVLAHLRKHIRSPRVNHELVIARAEAQVNHISRHPGDTLSDKLESLRQCIDKLPEHYALPLTKRYIEELPATAVAEKLALSSEALKKRLQRGRTMLLECIRQKLLILDRPNAITFAAEPDPSAHRGGDHHG